MQSSFLKKCGAGFIAAALTVSFYQTSNAADKLSPPESGLSVKIDADRGSYEIARKHPAWKFGGSLQAPLKNLASSRGHDDVGDYQQFSFEWQAQSPMSGFIRIYDSKPLALFSQTCGAAMATPPPAFPDFTKISKELHVFSYAFDTFSPPAFAAEKNSTPWLLFDDSANAMIISP